MNIGIDIDGCLVDDDTYRIDTMTKYCYENNLGELDYPYKYEDKCNWQQELKDDYRNKYYFEYIKNMPAKMYASEVIKKLHSDGNKIIIITGRYKTRENSKLGYQMRKNTIKWLKKNKIVYDEICFANCPKVKEIQEKNIDIMIDDSVDVIKEVSKYTKVLCYDNRYNTSISYDNMIRVYSWYDIYSKIKSIVK